VIIITVTICLIVVFLHSDVVVHGCFGEARRMWGGCRWGGRGPEKERV
jgi:hypothetical protein